MGIKNKASSNPATPSTGRLRTTPLRRLLWCFVPCNNQPGSAKTGFSNAEFACWLPTVGLPNSPQGRTTSTTAITTNSTTSVSLENENSTPAISTSPIQMHSALIWLISKAATKAPDTEPMPPITTTAKALPMALMSSSRWADSRGNCKAPPRPAKKHPRAKTAVKSQAWRIPKALAMARSSVAARTKIPQRVRCSSSHSKAHTAGPAAIKNKSSAGNCRPKIATAPPKPGARGPGNSSGPQEASTASLMIKPRANVASNCSNSGAW